MYVCAVALLLAGVVAGHFDSTIFFTLLGAGGFLLAAKVACTLYYCRKL